MALFFVLGAVVALVAAGFFLVTALFVVAFCQGRKESCRLSRTIDRVGGRRGSVECTFQLVGVGRYMRPPNTMCVAPTSLARAARSKE